MSYNMEKSTILVISDNESERQTLNRILSNEYKLLQTGSGRDALRMMCQYDRQIAVIYLDLDLKAEASPDFELLSYGKEIDHIELSDDINGYELLKHWHEDLAINHIPLIAAAHNQDFQAESDSLKAGVWDFIHMPYDADLIHYRIKNVIGRSETQTARHMRYLHEFDEMTGIYNQRMFLLKTSEMLRKYPEKQFVFVHMDINNFHLVNEFYGVHEGDSLLKYIAGLLVVMSENIKHFKYGRYAADVFCFCMPYKDRGNVIQLIERLREDINRYHFEHVLVPVFGIYIADHSVNNTHTISDYARLASKHCKDNYIQNYAFYEHDMNEKIICEQKIINRMKTALSKEQFVLYIQPKYDLHSNRINGGEVLVRWAVPEEGLLKPGEFVPLFERNGFITELDYYIWEHTCQVIRRWLDEGKKPFPVSVNISRISLYNPQLADVIMELVNKYNIPTRLLHLELTESACTDNAEEIKDTMQKLRKCGFCILMDDFGSGYSSLSVLKEIPVDILKIDMHFISGNDMSSRGKNILASVVRMAKWLNMSVIVEGVEKESQVAFLRSIGCEFVQGYYIAKPMPVDEYERVAFGGFKIQKEIKNSLKMETDIVWDASPETDLIFSNMLQAVALYEYVPGKETIDRIRANDAYYDLMGDDDLVQNRKGMQNAVDKECRKEVIQAFEAVSRSKKVSQCVYHRTNENGSVQWIEMKLKYINSVANRNVIFSSMSDVTDQKEIERELHKYRKAIIASENKVETILIVDDIKMNRQILRSMFESEYNILEAADGREALDIVYKNGSMINLILLDVVMPVMDGREFLERKSADISIADIPVVVITLDDSPQQQINALSLGANDYVVKPFIPEVVIRRVCNVMESQKRVGEVLQSTENNVNITELYDYPTGLYNRNTAGKMIRDSRRSRQGMQALLLIKIGNFYQVNERYGHTAVDKAIQDFAAKLRSCFRKGDILARYGGDEFVVFVLDVPSWKFIEEKCNKLMKEIHLLVQDEADLECWIGAAVASEENKDQNFFMELLGQADQALNQAKQKGKNQWHLYEGI